MLVLPLGPVFSFFIENRQVGVWMRMKIINRVFVVFPAVLVFSGLSVSLFSPQAQASPAEGKKIFAAKGCGGCHSTAGPSRVKSIADKRKQKGPDLWFAGSKFRAAWLGKWLKKPNVIRGAEWGTLERSKKKHAGLSAGEAPAVAGYLMTLTNSRMKKGVIKKRKKMKRRNRFKAKKLFEKSQACYACHKTPVKKGKKVRRIVGGVTGPTLVAAGKRLKADWIYSFLKSPKTYAPFGGMPVYGKKAATKFRDKDLKLLAEYIASF